MFSIAPFHIHWRNVRVEGEQKEKNNIKNTTILLLPKEDD